MKNVRRIQGEIILLCVLGSVALARPTSNELTRIYGVHAVQESELRDSLHLLHGVLVETGTVRDSLTAIARRIQTFYFARGYYSIKIDSLTADFSSDSSLVRCAAYLAEGKQTLIDSIQIAGDTVLGRKRIHDAMATQRGGVLDARALAEDIDALLVMYEDIG